MDSTIKLLCQFIKISQDLSTSVKISVSFEKKKFIEMCIIALGTVLFLENELL